MSLIRWVGPGCALLLLLGATNDAVAAATKAAGEKPSDSRREEPWTVVRSNLLAEGRLPELVPLPVPTAAIALPDDWRQNRGRLSVRLSHAPAGELSVRRVAGHDGRLHLELRGTEPLSGTAQVSYAGRLLGQTQMNGSLWLSLKPAVDNLLMDIVSPASHQAVELRAATTLVEVRGRQLFVNGEPFLIKGAMGRAVNESDAGYIHSLGLNTLRGLGALADAEQFGFMSIASLNFGEAASTKVIQGPDEEFQQSLGKCMEWLREHSAEPVASPNTLILQLGNERTGPGTDRPGTQPLTRARRHVSQLLGAAWNTVKPLAPMLPVGYANQDLGFLAPDCMDVYMHNSYLEKDRYGYPWEDFIRWQGCLPPSGKAGQGRPFVNSEFGANRYLCQSYLEGPNNPFLERIHAWNFICRWAEFMEHGTAGGAIYCLYDLETPRDQGCSRFGILTYDRQPKLACWEIGHLWRDFEVNVQEEHLMLTYKRDYWARNCRLNVDLLDGTRLTAPLEDFAPHSKRSLSLRALSVTNAGAGLRWSLDFTTHSGLTNGAAGAWPRSLEESDFLERLKSRDTYLFLRELFDTEVLAADGTPAPGTLAEMARGDGIIPVALRKRNGVTYLLLIAREKPENPLREGLSIDVAFRGKVVKVDDMTGKPLAERVEALPIPGGLRLNNIQAARIPGPIGERSRKPFILPIYRISP